MFNRTIRAICRRDFDRIAVAQKYLKSNPSFKRQVYLDRIEEKDLTPDEIQGLSFHEVYGIFFCGELAAHLVGLTQDKCRIAYLSVGRDKLMDGIYDSVVAAGRPAILYFWVSQGYPRGGVAWRDDMDCRNSLEALMTQKPWDFGGILSV